MTTQTRGEDLKSPPTTMTPLSPKHLSRPQLTLRSKSKNDLEPVHGLIRTTTIHVESMPADAYDGHSVHSYAYSASNEGEKKGVRKILSKFNNQQAEAQNYNVQHVENLGGELTYTVSVSATSNSRPKVRHHEVKGLEQAASIKRWVGRGNAAEAWGKLKKDPELWDCTGDTLVYFSNQRAEASLRVPSAILAETKSDLYLNLLEEGQTEHQNSPSANSGQTKPPSIVSSPMKHGKNSGSKDDSVEEDEPVLYSICFPAPPVASKLDILRHHITTRNVFALLMNKPLVGLNFYQALVDLHERLSLQMPMDADSAGMIIKYLIVNGFNDVRNDAGAAAGLLAWCEEEEVRWQEGWREGFVHCVGMWPQLEAIPEVGDISPLSHKLLHEAYNNLRDKILGAEERLSSFHFMDVWPSQSAGHAVARTSFDRFSRFLRHFFENIYKSWPPRKTRENKATWLTRDNVQRLQKDFGMLYDYCVDRDVMWDQGQSRMVSKVTGDSFHHEGEDVRMADLFSGFDRKCGHTQIPHPYPLLPSSIPIQQNTKHSLFKSKKDKSLDRQVANAYAEASNMRYLLPEVASNELLKAFIHFEQTDQINEINPLEARKGRWILLYCVLQILAEFSVDTPYLSYTDDVTYPLNPSLKGTPPWRIQADAIFDQASPTMSHCWTTYETWSNGRGEAWTSYPGGRHYGGTENGSSRTMSLSSNSTTLSSNEASSIISKDLPSLPSNRTSIKSSHSGATSVSLDGSPKNTGIMNRPQQPSRGNSAFDAFSAERPSTVIRGFSYHRDSTSVNSRVTNTNEDIRRRTNDGRGMGRSDYIAPEGW